jgi:alkylation response protein AidB-like acyl-CoA dehydrogenase
LTSERPGATEMRKTVDFLLFDWLGVGALTQRPRFAEHSVETFASVLDTCERIAREKFAPFNRLADTQEPHFDGRRVHLPEATRNAVAAYAESGMLAAAQDYEVGGMQLPCVIEMAANAFFHKASIAMTGYALLTSGNANLLMAHGTPAQREVFAKNEFSGRWFGTMCLSEPQAGSSLSDVATRAVPDGDDFEADPLGPRYRLRGNKMWISAGEHELSENIVHLVLAKIAGADGRTAPGTKGISLFIVPKHRVDAAGQLTGERNDVVLAGLNHKLGYRGTTNTLLNFGEKGGAVGYRVGQPGEGLRCMFHMMNEARIGVGLGAVMLGMAGYEASLDYARTRTQGRPMTAGGKDATQPQVPIIEHADVKRMLLAQKSYAEGGLALELYCARLVDELHTGDQRIRLGSGLTAAGEAGLLLEVLTPIAKSWPSEWCLEANSLAIQVHGGYGYTRDFPVEQYWRDNRLNMIHEGTHGIQGLDLLGRKVLMHEGAALKLLAARMHATMRAANDHDTLRSPSRQLQTALQALESATRAAWAEATPEQALANATPYLQAFGHVVLAWLWLDVALACEARLVREQADAATLDGLHGRLAAMRYFYVYELPRIDAWLLPVAARQALCREMRDNWF